MTASSEPIDWSTTREVVRRGFRSSFHYSVATVGEDGAPHVTPIGSIMLTEPGRGIFFDIFASRLGSNLDEDPRLCVLVVDSRKRFWLESLVRGRFVTPPALRLVGTAGPRRAATEAERKRWLRRVRPLRRLRGHSLLWGDLSNVRDLTFHTVIPVDVGGMTRQLPAEGSFPD